MRSRGTGANRGGWREARLTRRPARIQAEIDRIGVGQHGLIEGRHLGKVRRANAQRLERRHPPVALVGRRFARLGSWRFGHGRARPVVSGDHRLAQLGMAGRLTGAACRPPARWPRSTGDPTPTISNAARPTCANLCCVANTPTSPPCARPHPRRPRPDATRRVRSCVTPTSCDAISMVPCCG